jgi:hypothetical protein
MLKFCLTIVLCLAYLDLTVLGKSLFIVCHEKESWANWNNFDDIKLPIVKQKFSEWNPVGPVRIQYAKSGVRYPFRFFTCGKEGYVMAKAYDDNQADLWVDSKYKTKYQLDWTKVSPIVANDLTMILKVKLAGSSDAEPEYSKDKDDALIEKYAALAQCKKAYSLKWAAKLYEQYKIMVQAYSEKCPTLATCDEVAVRHIDLEIARLNQKRERRKDSCVKSELIQKEADKLKEQNKKKFELFMSFAKIALAAVPFGEVLNKIAETTTKIVELAQEITEAVVDAGTGIAELSELRKTEKLELTAKDISYFEAAIAPVDHILSYLTGFCRSIINPKFDKKTICPKPSKMFLEMHSRTYKSTSY